MRRRHIMTTRLPASCDTRRSGWSISNACGIAGRRMVAEPPDRTQAALAPTPRRRRLLHRPRRLRFSDQGGLGALLRRGRHRPRLGLPADAVDRCHGRQPGTDDGCRAAADRATAPDRLGPVDGGTATALGRCPCGSSSNGRATMGCHWPSWSSLVSRACPRGWFAPVWPSTMRPLTVDSARAMHQILRVTTCLLLLGHGALGATPQQARADCTLCVYWPS